MIMKRIALTGYFLNSCSNSDDTADIPPSILLKDLTDRNALVLLDPDIRNRLLYVMVWYYGITMDNDSVMGVMTRVLVFFSHVFQTPTKIPYFIKL